VYGGKDRATKINVPKRALEQDLDSDINKMI